MIFKKNKELKDIISTSITDEHYKRIDRWKGLYAGYLKEFHEMEYHTVGQGKRRRRRRSLRMAKVASAELAKLIFNERVEINIANATLDKYIKSVLEDNRFYKQFPYKLESSFLALGGLILKANPKELEDGTHKIQISYVLPENFIPISWENGLITEGAFLNVVQKEKKTYYLFEIHRWKMMPLENDNGEVVFEDGEPVLVKTLEIKNELYMEDKENGVQGELKQVPLETLEQYKGLEKVSYIQGLEDPIFVYAKPHEANNFELDSPLGISIFANAEDTMYALDVAFDSFITEFRLGKRRILVPDSAIRTVVNQATGEVVRYFDADDEVYQAFRGSDPDKDKIHDNTVGLRVDEHIAAINALLDLFSMQIGLSAGTFNFDGKTVKTATEIISENSKTYQTVRANEDVLEEALKRFIYTIGDLSELYDIHEMPEERPEVEFNWDDSIIKDKYSDSEYYTGLVNNKLISRRRAIAKILEIPEKEAVKIMQEIKEEIEMMAPKMPDYDSLLGSSLLQVQDEDNENKEIAGEEETEDDNQ